MKKLIDTLIILLVILMCPGSAVITWIPDKIAYPDPKFSQSGTANWNYFLSVISNGQLNKEDNGNFQLIFNLDLSKESYVGFSSCLSWTDGAQQTNQLIKLAGLHLHSRIPANNTILSRYFQTSVKKFESENATSSLRTTSFNFNFRALSQNYTISTIRFDVRNCSRTRTVSDWGNPKRWHNRVPSASDDVVFPKQTGVVLLSYNLSVKSLTMDEGEIVLIDTGCAKGWTVDTRSATSEKCYRMFQTPLNFPDAVNFCNAQAGDGSHDRNLIHIGDRTENELAFRLCRSGNAKNLGCWIGMRDSNGLGYFDWVEPIGIGKASINSRFHDWRRFELNNMTVSYGDTNQGGERCVAIAPWQDDPLLLEQGGWLDLACSLRKPFICQSFATTVRYTLKVAGNVVIGQAAIVGGIVDFNGAANISNLEVSRSAILIASNPSATVRVSTMTLVDGSTFLDQSITKLNELSFIGEQRSDGDTHGAQSTFTLAPNSSLTIDCFKCYNDRSVEVNSRMISYGSITINSLMTLNLLQGGDLSSSRVTFFNENSKLRLGGYASRLSVYDSFELRLSHKAPVVGEYIPSLNSSGSGNTGIYKLRVQEWGTAAPILTACIPYNASEGILANMLNSITAVSSRGGVTVRRYGSQTDANFGFGFTYRIELDSISTKDFSKRPLIVDLHCYGSSCGDCADTKVEYPPGFSDSCPRPSKYSVTDTNVCIIPPNIIVSRLTRQSFMSIVGKGSVEVSGSKHRLPPRSPGVISVISGIGVVSADQVAWNTLSASGDGKVILAGTSWTGWDSSYLLYLPSWTYQREYSDRILHAPPCNLRTIFFNVKEKAMVLASGPNSVMITNSSVWGGGVIGGIATFTVTKNMTLNGENKFLKYGMVLSIAATCTSSWFMGNISLSNGANISVLGIWLVHNPNSIQPVTIGAEASLSSNDSWSSVDYPRIADGRSWSGYYDSNLSPIIRKGWYLNSICGEFCLTRSDITFSGKFQCDKDSSVQFLLPLNMIGSSRMTVLDHAVVILISGGILGNDMIVDLSTQTKIQLNGGKLLMEAGCTIRGEGELQVTAGAHDMAFSVDAHITISGGSLVWPSSRGDGQTITFNGGLLIEGNGKLIVEPFSTKIIIFKMVYLKDQSLIQFPLIGIAAQASPFDRADAPDSSPRGNLTSTETMIWEGGTLTGKADFNALNEMYLDGEVKYIRSLAKLVNRGHCEWGSGDLITSDNGDFQNLGTIQQMFKEGSVFDSSIMYKGSELPVENGGDSFAFEYHSWDMDTGKLDFSQYIKLRTQFVSRVPNGWTAADQY